ncbi:sodium:melibiose symporter [Sphingomonas melonis TY]|jgi:glycoside/pentoside/hexuronide:cation symporter, GPH family|uniref:Sodium:melibiose symporter n=1 Tax=Sphingomonas melonis TY TaxID=621456 RepID=A0A154NAP4_9SPHN|nr:MULTISPECIES: MFS transporter [Sphingomonas]AOW23811.1 sodium:melibiose symporter [Sphingomonas melonis TY]ATI54818.1 MFS transporter [Sphingomonas melonis]KZB96798.1 sodium:melibiose symporter [Sphingomonas melonis TY]MBX8846121.1 MFS transporter [Sphingomonas melonis]MBX8855300.1 MFS transporter [Sphingomonas melonis]
MASIPFEDVYGPPQRRATARHEGHAAVRLIGFGSLAVPLAGAGLPLVLFVPQLYASHFGLSLATIGFIFFLGRFWDVASDPIVGALSDRTRTRFGRRRPWIAAGGLLFGVGSALLFFPPATVAPLYFGAALFVFYAGWTMIEIPFSAWAGELSGQYHERTRIVTYQQTMRAVGLLLVLILPTLIEQWRPADGVLKLHATGAFILTTLVLALMLSLTAIAEPPIPAQRTHRIGFWRSAGLVFRDRLLLRVLASDVAVTAGQSIRAGLIAFFCVSYMGLPQWASGLYLLQFVFGVAAGPIWLAIGRRLGKRETAIAGELAQAAINIALLAVFPDMLWLLIALAVAQGLTQGSGNLMLRAMVADVADAHELSTGHNRTGLFFSVFSLATKAGPAIGIGLALPLLAWLGFQPRGQSAPAALDALKYVFALGPAAAHIISAALIWHFPLDQTRHAQIRRALDARAATVPVEA